MTKEDAEAYNRRAYPAVLKALEKVAEGTPEVQTYEVSNSTFHKIAHQGRSYCIVLYCAVNRLSGRKRKEVADPYENRPPHEIFGQSRASKRLAFDQGLETGGVVNRAATNSRGCCFSSLVVIVSSVSAQTGSTVPAVETIVARMAQARAANRHRFRPYVVTREYKLFGKERQNTKSQVTAEVTFVPPDSKKYAFQKSSGAGLGGRIVGRMLESEAEIAKDYSSTDISPNNYDFRFIREEELAGRRCYVLELNPRRKEKNLVRGNIWVDADTYLVHRTEG